MVEYSQDARGKMQQQRNEKIIPEEPHVEFWGHFIIQSLPKWSHLNDSLEGTVDNYKCTVIGWPVVTQHYVSPLFASRDVGFDKHNLQIIWQVDKVNAHTKIIKCIR